MGISIIQAAEMWGVKEVTVRKWVKNKALIKKIGLKFDVFRIGKYDRVDIPAEEVARIKKLLKPRKQWRSGQTIFREID